MRSVSMKPHVQSTPGLRSTNSFTVWGSSVRLTCPRWCVADHVSSPPVFVEDFVHESGESWLSLPVGRGREQVLGVRVAQWPFGDGRGPVVVLDASGSGESAELVPSAAVEELGRLVDYGVRQRERLLTLLN